MLWYFLIAKLRRYSESRTFQKDGAPPHCANKVRNILDNKLLEDVWEEADRFHGLRSLDLTACDYYLWGHIKDIVYRDPQ